MSLPRLDFTERGTTVLADVSGEVDAANAEDLFRALASAVTHSTELLVIDLSAVTYLDSAGIHLLFRIDRMLQERAAGLRVVVPPGSVVEDTLRYADALRLFSTVESSEDAAADGLGWS